MSKTLHQEATEAREAVIDFFNEVAKALKLHEILTWLNGKIEKLSH